MIYLIIYIVGVIIASFIIPKVFPYREDLYEIGFNYTLKITEDRHKEDNVCRVLIWPLLVVVFIVLLPIAVVGNLVEKIFEMLE